MKKIYFYGEELTIFKAGLHTHSTVSEDGVITPEQMIALYAEHGYDCLAFTDHRHINPVHSYDGRGMVIISGMEIHPQRKYHGQYGHLLALGLPNGFPLKFTYAQQAVDAVNDAGGIVFIPHPYWTGYPASRLAQLKNICGTEVFNGATRENGKAYNMQSWDEFLNMGKDYTALSVDDAHHLHDLFRGWTMICARQKSASAILTALKEGRFYATQGPEFSSLLIKNGVFEAEFSSVVTAQLISNERHGYHGHFDNGDGTPRACTSLQVDISDMPVGNYIRCQLVDASGKMAWSNPIRRIDSSSNGYRLCGGRS